MENGVLSIGFGVFDKSKCSHRVNESTRPVFGGMIAQRQTHGGISEAILTVGVAWHARYALPDKCLRRVAFTSFNYGAGPFVPSGQLHSVARL